VLGAVKRFVCTLEERLGVVCVARRRGDTDGNSWSERDTFAFVRVLRHRGADRFGDQHTTGGVEPWQGGAELVAAEARGDATVAQHPTDEAPRLADGVGGTEREFVIMVIAVSCVKLLSAHNSTQHTSRKHKV
jgi:hypothetical protein